MPRDSVPKYRRHKPSGQAVVTLTDPTGTRKDFYLGRWGSKASKAEYGRIVAEWTAAGWCIPHSGPAPADLSVNEILVRFWAHVETHYRDPDGGPTPEVDAYRLSLRPLKALYGHTPARDFGPLALKAVRGAMVEGGLSRKVVNQRVGRIRRCFKGRLRAARPGGRLPRAADRGRAGGRPDRRDGDGAGPAR